MFTSWCIVDFKRTKTLENQIINLLWHFFLGFLAYVDVGNMSLYFIFSNYNFKSSRYIVSMNKPLVHAVWCSIWWTNNPNGVLNYPINHPHVWGLHWMVSPVVESKVFKQVDFRMHYDYSVTNGCNCVWYTNFTGKKNLL